VFVAGDVLLWRSFPFTRDPTSERKDRYFVCFGYSSRLSVPILVYLCTTTTKIAHYERDGSRSRHTFLRLHAGDFGLPQDCVLDFDFNFYADIQELQLATHRTDIEKVGSVPPDRLRQMWKYILIADGIALVVKRDIHFALNQIGLVGLKQPS
jgi:hypothetical protein